MNNNVDISNEINGIRNSIELLEKHLRKLKRVVDALESKSKKSYKDVPGLIGKFDGFNLITQDGKTHKVPANYAAKSMLVFGDTLKMIEDDGKTLFKQVEKVEKTKLSGVVSKKDGKWYVLTDSGTFRISDVAADFNELKTNDEVKIYVPADLNSPYGALENKKRKKDSEKSTDSNSEKNSEDKVSKSSDSSSSKSDKKAEKTVEKKSEPAKAKEKKPAQKTESQKKDTKEDTKSKSETKTEKKEAPKSKKSEQQVEKKAETKDNSKKAESTKKEDKPQKQEDPKDASVKLTDDLDEEDLM